MQTETGSNGGQALLGASAKAAQTGARLFGFFGAATFDHLPYRTADGRFDPAPSLGRKGIAVPAETYSAADLNAQPTLAQMTDAALGVLSAHPGQPFILFVECLTFASVIVDFLLSPSGSALHPVRRGWRRRFRTPRQQPR